MGQLHTAVSLCNTTRLVIGCGISLIQVSFSNIIRGLFANIYMHVEIMVGKSVFGTMLERNVSPDQGTNASANPNPNPNPKQQPASLLRGRWRPGSTPKRVSSSLGLVRRMYISFLITVYLSSRVNLPIWLQKWFGVNE